MEMNAHRSWFAIDGQLERIDFEGPSYFRFPEAVAEYVIRRYSKVGDWVLDPFAGFGTTLVVAERLGRHGLGFEVDPRRASFAASRVPLGRLKNARTSDITALDVPPIKLLVTSPPYGSFRSDEAIDDPTVYCEGARSLFRGLLRFLDPAARIVVEVSQVRDQAGTRPLVWQLGLALTNFLALEEDVVRVNTGDAEAGPGYQHSHILVFSQRQ